MSLPPSVSVCRSLSLPLCHPPLSPAFPLWHSCPLSLSAIVSPCHPPPPSLCRPPLRHPPLRTVIRPHTRSSVVSPRLSVSVILPTLYLCHPRSLSLTLYDPFSLSPSLSLSPTFLPVTHSLILSLTLFFLSLYHSGSNQEVGAKQCIKTCILI